jgi:enoyl-CoA hydratase
VKDKITFITLNRPEKRNALNSAILSEVAKTRKRFENNPDAWVGVLSDVGKGFSNGMDQVDTQVDPPSASGGDLRQRQHGLQAVGAVHGFALGTGYSLGVDYFNRLMRGAEESEVEHFTIPQTERRPQRGAPGLPREGGPEIQVQVWAGS